MEETVERRVEGTFRTMEDVDEAVQHLLDEGYQPQEILLIAGKDSGHEEKLMSFTEVNTELVDLHDEESFWSRLVEVFTVSDEEEEDEFTSLEEYGVREENAERFNEALQADEIVLLVDSAAPRNNGTLSEVNEQVLEDSDEHQTSETTHYQGGTIKMTDKNNQNIDEVSSDEAEAIKSGKENEKKDATPTNVETSETDEQAMENTQDASQAQNKRKEEAGNSADAETTPDEGPSLETTPELTGDEETVEKDASNHRYPDNVAKGTVDGKENDK